jgi:predicted SnoaL-like aldol condensation-catalyzing enzyme
LSASRIRELPDATLPHSVHLKEVRLCQDDLQCKEEWMGLGRTRAILALAVALAVLSGLHSAAVAGSCCPSHKAKQVSKDRTAEADEKSHGLDDKNVHRAIAVLEALESGDASVIDELVSADAYIQHNLGFPSGREALTTALKTGMLDGTTVRIVRSFGDDDYVVTHSEYMFMGAHQVGFDVFRFEDGLIVEHWDNLQAFTEPNPSGRTMLDGRAKVSEVDKTEENKALVERFIKGVLIGGDFASMDSYFDGDAYIQHNPRVGDGLSTLVEAIQSGGIVMTFEKLHFVHGSGDFVLAVSEGRFNGEHVAFYDLFRVENGFIAEHWDVVQAIPPESEWANGDGKF